MSDASQWFWWKRFWHEPVRAERLALARILLACACLTDQLIQILPHFDMFFGERSVAPVGTHDAWLLENWRWTILVFNPDDMAILYAAFWLRVAVTVVFLFGWHTRLMNVLLYFLTICFINRNPVLRNGADDVLMAGLFLMMFMPTGAAWSLDSLRRRRKGGAADLCSAAGPTFIPPWGVRIIQIQVCMIYFSTGLAKLVRPLDWEYFMDEFTLADMFSFDWYRFFDGTWWEGTSIHYVLNDTTMSRMSFVQLPEWLRSLWVTAPATYLSVWWETLFPVLVIWRRTRKWALWFGVLFHLGIWLTIEIGWFSFYTLSLYGVWVPGEFWDRFRSRRPSVVRSP